MEKIQELVVRAQAGDKEAYSQIVQRFQDMAVAWAYSFTGDYGIAEDARQEAFIGAWCDLITLRNPAAFPAWLRQIVRRQSIQLIRNRRVLTVPLENAEHIAASGPTPVEVIQARDTREKILRAIDRLPDHEREATRLFFIEGFSINEISRRIQIPVVTVRSRLRSGRARLKQRLMQMVRKNLSSQYKAGDRRAQTAATQDAVKLFGDEIDLLLREPDRLAEQQLASRRKAGDLLCAQGRMLRFLGQMDQALASFERGMGIRELKRDPAWRARFNAEIGMTHFQSSNYPLARRHLQSARTLARQQSDQAPLHVAILNGLGACASGEGDFTKAGQLFREALKINKKAGSAELEAELHNNLGLMHWKAGQLDQALASYRLALGQWKKVHNRFGEALSLMNTGIIQENQGKFQLARQSYESALALAREINFLQVQAASLGNLASLALLQVNWSAAQKHGESCRALARRIGDRRIEAIALENLALAALGASRFDEGQSAAREARKIALDIGDQERIFSLDLVELEYQIMTGEPGALNQFRELKKTLKKRGYEAEWPRLLRLEVQALARQGQLKGTKTGLRQALAEARKQKNKAEEKRILALEKHLSKSESEE